MNSDYDEIRPYNDEEATLAFKRIAEAPELVQFAEFLFPGQGDKHLRDLIRPLKSVYEFQSKVMANVIHNIVDQTSSGITSGGLESLDDGKKHILISNHRDIILDPAIIQIILFDHGLSTSEIAVGDNLIASPLIEDIFRSNRMIKVVRGGTAREKYNASTVLSGYLRENVASGKCSIWIAQRNGRSKDGHDGTEQGVLKMLSMSGSGDFIKDFEDISLLPVAVSYQYEPCDFLKARELYVTRRREYVKVPGEDTNSIITGVTQYKGGIDFEFSPSLTEEEIEKCSRLEKNERFKKLARIIDEKINSRYRLWDTNYMASDLLHDSDEYSDKYTSSAKNHFIDYIEKGLSSIMKKDPSITDREELKEIFLNIYANPVCRRS